MNKITEFFSWWLWNRWTIYCPRRSVVHLFDQNRRIVMSPFGAMEFPSRKEFNESLFHDDEDFVWPCSFSGENCGRYRGMWSPKMGMLPMEIPKEE